jgi:hypothetical protein
MNIEALLLELLVKVLLYVVTLAAAAVVVLGSLWLQHAISEYFYMRRFNKNRK